MSLEHYMPKNKHIRVISEFEPRSPAMNQALDQALVESVETGALPTVRFYLWDRNCVSIAYRQPLDDINKNGLPIVRRKTGGSALIHYKNLETFTYSAAIPIEWFDGLKPSWTAVSNWSAAGVRALDLDAFVKGSHHIFLRYNKKEMKLGGNAFYLHGKTVLVHGSINYSIDRNLENESIVDKKAQVNVDQILALNEVTNLDNETARDLWMHGFLDCLKGCDLYHIRISDQELDRAKELLKDFEDPSLKAGVLPKSSGACLRHGFE